MVDFCANSNSDVSVQNVRVKPEQYDYYDIWHQPRVKKSFEKAQILLEPLLLDPYENSEHVLQTTLTFSEDAHGQRTVTSANGNAWHLQSAWRTEDEMMAEPELTNYWLRLKDGNLDKLYVYSYSSSYLYLSSERWVIDVNHDIRVVSDTEYNNFILFNFQK